MDIGSAQKPVETINITSVDGKFCDLISEEYILWFPVVSWATSGHSLYRNTNMIKPLYPECHYVYKCSRLTGGMDTKKYSVFQCMLNLFLQYFRCNINKTHYSQLS